jgi:hypothetical protein
MEQPCISIAVFLPDRVDGDLAQFLGLLRPLPTVRRVFSRVW